jgi:high-affinity Fe2+/Pb2+ permease
MDFFWGNVFEYFKERRLASLFFGSLFGLGLALALGCLLAQVIVAYNLLDYLNYILTAAALLVMLLVIRGVRQARARRRDRFKSSPLSRDELRKARSKLMKAKH